MEPWTVNKYAEPFLNIQQVRVESGDSPFLLIDTPQGELELTVGGAAQSLEEIAAWLGKLRSPDSDAWGRIYRGQMSDAERKILLQADNLSLIEERHLVEDFSARAADLHDIESDISIYSGLVAKLVQEQNLHAESLSLLRDIYHGYLTQSLNAANIKVEAPSHTSAGSDLTNTNFYGAVLQRQARYLSRHCPLALAACTKMLDVSAGLAVDSSEGYWRKSLEHWHSGIYNTQDVQQYLDATFHLVSKFDVDGAARIFSGPSGFDDHGQSGTNFMVKAEGVAIKALGAFGTHALLDLVRQKKEVPNFLRKGFFLEEYHVTKRFVEMITPMLAHRLSPTIRARMYQYFSEEVGHEVYERKTCLALGISERDLASAFPFRYTPHTSIFSLISLRQILWDLSRRS